MNNITLEIAEIRVEEPDVENHVWITNYSKKLFVREMSTSHINNAIRCWEGNGNCRIPHGYLGGKAKWLKIFNQELLNRQ